MNQENIFKNRVFIKLEGEIEDINDLKRTLTSKEWEIVEMENIHYLTSQLIDNLVDKTEIKKLSWPFLALLNGGASIANHLHKQVTTNSYIRYDEQGLKNIVISLEPFEFRLPLKTNNYEIPSNDKNQSLVETWVEKAQRHDNIKDILFFFKEVSWINLYKIYEIIRDDVGDEVQLFKDFPNHKSNIKKFTNIANNRNAIGEKARHGSKKNAAPSYKLSIEEAHSIVRNLFEEWANTKE
ncbi:MAG: hypothetical protein V4613_09550 [Bacteroidota bacterium]